MLSTFRRARLHRCDPFKGVIVAVVYSGRALQEFFLLADRPYLNTARNIPEIIWKEADPDDLSTHLRFV